MSLTAGRISAIALCIALTMPATGVELREFETEAQRGDFKLLIDELRCLVCQNQNLADSDADLAKDLRDEIHEMLEQGKTRSQVIDFMVERYGDFVRYRPPLKPTTLALWFGPFALLVGGLWLLTRQIRARRITASPQPLDASERDRLKALLDD